MAERAFVIIFLKIGELLIASTRLRVSTELRPRPATALCNLPSSHGCILYFKTSVEDERPTAIPSIPVPTTIKRTCDATVRNWVKILDNTSFFPISGPNAAASSSTTESSIFSCMDFSLGSSSRDLPRKDIIAAVVIFCMSLAIESSIAAAFVFCCSLSSGVWFCKEK